MRDRIVSIIATAIVGIVAIALLFLALLNGIGAVLAHFDSQRYHASRPCASGAAQSSACIATQRVTVNDIFGTSLLITLPDGSTRLIEQGKLVVTPTVREQDSNAAIKAWNGKIVEL